MEKNIDEYLVILIISLIVGMLGGILISFNMFSHHIDTNYYPKIPNTSIGINYSGILYDCAWFADRTPTNNITLITQAPNSLITNNWKLGWYSSHIIVCAGQN